MSTSMDSDYAKVDNELIPANFADRRDSLHSPLRVIPARREDQELLCECGGVDLDDEGGGCGQKRSTLACTSRAQLVITCTPI